MVQNGKDRGQQKEKFSFRSYITFYTRFPIPWWLFIASLVFSLINTEVFLAISKYVIQINKGELYNGVIIGYALLTVLNAAISMGSNICGEYGIQKVTLRARKLLWDKILHLPMREVERRQPSSLISGVVNDITQASAVIHMVFSTVASVYGFVRCCVEMARFNAKLSAYMLLLVPLAIGVFALVGQLQYRMMLRRYESLNTMTEFFSEHISAAKHVKAQAMEELETEEGLRAIDERYRADVYYAFMEVLQVFSNTLYTSIGSIAIALFGSDMIRKGQMPDTGINDFTTYKSRVDQYQAEVLTHYQTLKGTQGAMQYVGVLLDGPEEDPDAGYDLPEGQPEQDIVLDRVSFGYVPQQPVLHDLSLTIPAGKTTAMFSNWEQLRDIAVPGCLSFSCFMDYRDYPDTDRRLTDAALAWMAEEGPDFLFLYLGLTDCAGHDRGWMSPDYLDTLRGAWECIRRVAEASEGTYHLIVTADHGGHGRSHGTEEEEDMRIPILLRSADGAPLRPAASCGCLTDLAPTVCALMGLPAARDWEGTSLI